MRAKKKIACYRYLIYFMFLCHTNSKTTTTAINIVTNTIIAKNSHTQVVKNLNK